LSSSQGEQDTLTANRRSQLFAGRCGPSVLIGLLLADKLFEGRPTGSAIGRELVMANFYDDIQSRSTGNWVDTSLCQKRMITLSLKHDTL
jgi:hypothetical protein